MQPAFVYFFWNVQPYSINFDVEIRFFASAWNRTLDLDVLSSEIDDELDKSELSFVKISEEGAEEQFGILELPALVFIQNGIPNIYDEDLVSFSIEQFFKSSVTGRIRE